MKLESNIRILLEQAWQKRREGHYHTANDLVREAEGRCEKEDYATLGRIYHLYRQFAADQGNLEEALAHSQQSLQYYQLAAIPDKLAHAIRHLADLQYELKRYQDAEQTYQRALTLYRTQLKTHPAHLANALRGFALLLEAMGRKEAAVSVWKETQALYDACDIAAGVEEALQHLAAL